MAFSPWQILSPVQWARWTWSAVRGGGAGEDEAGGPEGDPEDEDSQAETKSLSFRQVHALLPRFGRATIHPSIRGSFCVRARVCACVCMCVCVCVVATRVNRVHGSAAVPALNQVPAVQSEVQDVVPSRRVFSFPRFSVSFLNLTQNLQSLRIPVCLGPFL